MTRKEITIEQYNKLKDCIVIDRMTGKQSKRKLVRRNKRWALVAWSYKDSNTNEQFVLQNLYQNSYVTNA